MGLPNVYTYNYGQLSLLFKKIIEGQAPTKFTQQHLKDIGFVSSNHRSFIPILKALGFLSSDGVPTQRYHNYRNNALSKKILGTAIKEAYSDIFNISAKPKASDKKLIQGKFKSIHNCSDRSAEMMAKTFFAILELADIDGEVKKPTKIEQKEKPKDTISNSERLLPQEQTSSKKIQPSLNYNIQIHLPATKDIEVYNAIFKSLKEHLIE